MGYGILVEGETDYARLTQDGIPAFGIPGANTWKSTWNEYFSDVPVLYLWQEPGKGGMAFVEAVAADFPAIMIIKASDYKKAMDAPGEQAALPMPDELALAFPHLAGPWTDPLTGHLHIFPDLSPTASSSTTPGIPVSSHVEPVEAGPTTSTSLTGTPPLANDVDGDSSEIQARAEESGDEAIDGSGTGYEDPKPVEPVELPDQVSD